MHAGNAMAGWVTISAAITPPHAAAADRGRVRVMEGRVGRAAWGWMVHMVTGVTGIIDVCTRAPQRQGKSTVPKICMQ